MQSAVTAELEATTIGFEYDVHLSTHGGLYSRVYRVTGDTKRKAVYEKYIGSPSNWHFRAAERHGRRIAKRYAKLRRQTLTV